MKSKIGEENSYALKGLLHNIELFLILVVKIVFTNGFVQCKKQEKQCKNNNDIRKE